MRTVFFKTTCFWVEWERERSSTRNQKWRTDSRQTFCQFTKLRPGLVFSQDAPVQHTGQHLSWLVPATAIQNVTYFKNNITHNVLNGSLQNWGQGLLVFEKNNIKPECSSKVKRRQYEWHSLLGENSYWGEKSVLLEKLHICIHIYITTVGNKHKIVCKTLNTCYNWLVLWSKVMTWRT